MKDVKIIATTYGIDLQKVSAEKVENLMSVADKYADEYEARGGMFKKESFKGVLLEALIDCYIKDKKGEYKFENPEAFAGGMVLRRIEKEIEFECEQKLEKTLETVNEDSKENTIDINCDDVDDAE